MAGEGPALLKWRARCDALEGRAVDQLEASELVELADGLFWLDRPFRSIEYRRSAYRAHVHEGDVERAALAAWRLFYEHHLVGESAPASGWLERCRRHVTDIPESGVAGWLAIAEADLALDSKHMDRAVDLARLAKTAGVNCGDRDLTAMALQVEGRASIAAGDRRGGLALLDEAMVAVINDELDPLFTGWVFCSVNSACITIADLGRAGEWTEAGLRWSSSLREGLFFPGLCRVYAAQVAYLRGDWPRALDLAERACGNLVVHDRRYAGEAFYLCGEVHRARGDLAEAERAFSTAHELGRLPQPGLARIRVADGRPDDARSSLVTALELQPGPPLIRAQLLAALADVAADLRDLSQLESAVVDLRAIADDTGARLIDALAAVAEGQLAFAQGNPRKALSSFQAAIDAFTNVGCAGGCVEVRLRLAAVAEAMNDAETARLEGSAALEQLERLGARTDADRARKLLARLDVAPAVNASTTASVLTERELEVLGLLADGATNRQIANQLYVSPHTVNRHVCNIYTKLGVNSRAAATARAFECGLLSETL